MIDKTKILLFILVLYSLPVCAQRNDFGVSGSFMNNSNGNNNVVSNDLFSGTSSVSIPLYSKTVNGLSLGVSINYNTKGIETDEQASAVGLGWQINYGGGIYRTIKGNPDEYYEAQGSGFHMQGFWHENKSQINYADLSVKGAINNKHLDGQADVFTAVFGGKKLDFIISDNDVVLTIPESPNLKIERTINGSVINSFTPYKGTVINDLGFIITDENGNKFYYVSGDKLQSTNWYASGTSTQYYNTLNWVLDKVVTYNGQIVTYTYLDSRLLSINSHYDQSYCEFISGAHNNQSIFDQYYGGINDNTSSVSFPVNSSI